MPNDPDSPEPEPTPEEIAALRDESKCDAERPKALTPFERRLKQERPPLERKLVPCVDPNRGLPASIEAEKGLLCSIMLDPGEVIALCMEKHVNASFFYIEAHAVIYAILLDLWSASKPIDIVSVTQTLFDVNMLEMCGGAGIVTDLFTYLPTAANAEYYIDILVDKYSLRSIITVCGKASVRAYEEQNNVAGIIDDFERDALAIRGTISDGLIHTSHDVVIEALDSINKAIENKGSIIGISWGYPEIDKMTTGLIDGEFIVIAARPSHGKTALAMNIMEHLAVTLELPVGVFSLEMSRRQLMQRCICSRAKVNMFRVMGGHASAEACQRMRYSSQAFSDAKIYFDDQSGISIQELRARARRMKAKYGIRALFIDYLQLLKSTSKRAQENRQQEVAEISTGIKLLAKELNIPIVALAQIGRDFEKRNVIRPRLSDLKESGSIEQDADTIGFLVREELLLEDETEILEAKGKAEFIIAKQRNGPIGPVKLTFLEEFVRFETRADYEPDDQGQLAM